MYIQFSFLATIMVLSGLLACKKRSSSLQENSDIKKKSVSMPIESCGFNTQFLQDEQLVNTSQSEYSLIESAIQQSGTPAEMMKFILEKAFENGISGVGADSTPLSYLLRNKLQKTIGSSTEQKAIFLGKLTNFLQEQMRGSAGLSFPKFWNGIKGLVILTEGLVAEHEDLAGAYRAAIDSFYDWNSYVNSTPQDRISSTVANCPPATRLFTYFNPVEFKPESVSEPKHKETGFCAKFGQLFGCMHGEWFSKAAIENVQSKIQTFHDVFPGSQMNNVAEETSIFLPILDYSKIFFITTLFQGRKNVFSNSESPRLFEGAEDFTHLENYGGMQRPLIHNSREFLEISDFDDTRSKRKSLLGVQRFDHISPSCYSIGADLFCTNLFDRASHDNYLEHQLPKMHTFPSAIDQILQVRGSLIVRSAGKIFVKGDNRFGILGLESQFFSNDFTQIPGLDNVTSVSLTSNYACAVSDKKLYCWGSSRNGGMGLGEVLAARKPMASQDIVGDVLHVETTLNTTCALVSRLNEGGDSRRNALYCTGSVLCKGYYADQAFCKPSSFKFKEVTDFFRPRYLGRVGVDLNTGGGIIPSSQELTEEQGIEVQWMSTKETDPFRFPLGDAAIRTEKLKQIQKTIRENQAKWLIFGGIRDELEARSNSSRTELNKKRAGTFLVTIKGEGKDARLDHLPISAITFIEKEDSKEVVLRVYLVKEGGSVPSKDADFIDIANEKLGKKVYGVFFGVDEAKSNGSNSIVPMFAIKSHFEAPASIKEHAFFKVSGLAQSLLLGPMVSRGATFSGEVLSCDHQPVANATVTQGPADLVFPLADTKIVSLSARLQLGKNLLGCATEPVDVEVFARSNPSHKIFKTTIFPKLSSVTDLKAANLPPEDLIIRVDSNSPVYHNRPGIISMIWSDAYWKKEQP